MAERRLERADKVGRVPSVHFEGGHRGCLKSPTFFSSVIETHLAIHLPSGSAGTRAHVPADRPGSIGCPRLENLKSLKVLP